MSSSGVFGITRFAEGAERLAFRLIYVYVKVLDAERAIDFRLANAEFLGMCKGANAVGFGHTESHVDSLVRENAVKYPKPVYNPTNATSRIEWEDKATAALAAELEATRR